MNELLAQAGLYVKKAWVFLMVSSADPKKTSLTIKALLYSFIPVALKAVGIICFLGVKCFDITQTQLETIALQLSDLSLTGLTWFAWGVAFVAGLRKLYRTITGKHEALGALRR